MRSASGPWLPPEVRVKHLTVLGFAGRLLLTLLLSCIFLALLSLAAFYVGWYLFGLTGHPAAPDAPAWAYLVYAIIAPLLCVAIAAWLMFRKTIKP